MAGGYEVYQSPLGTTNMILSFVFQEFGIGKDYYYQWFAAANKPRNS